MKREPLVAAFTAVLLGCALPGTAKAVPAASPRPVHGMGLRLPARATHGTVQRPRMQAAALPAAVDLTPWTVPVGDQGALNSCVTWAIDYAMLGWYSRRQGHVGQPFAPMYAYAQIEAMHGWNDGGAFVEDAMQIAEQQGIDTQADYSQGSYDWRTQPTTAQHVRAAAHRTQGSTFLYMPSSQAPGAAARSSIEAALASGRPVAVSIPVFAPFERLSPASHLLTVADVVGSSLLGYHEVLAVGYDDVGVRIQNSWGTGWGDRGFANLAWDFVEQDSVDASVMNGFVDNVNLAPAVGSVAPARGPLRGGTVVVIRGLGFEGAQTVAFGRVPVASFTVVDDTTIVATAPPAPNGGREPVLVGGPTGTSLPAAAFTYLPPRVTSVLPTDGATRGGTLVTLRGSSLRQVTAATVGGVRVSSLQVVSDSLLRIMTPPRHAGAATVRLDAAATSYAVGTFHYRRSPVIRRVVRLSSSVAVIRGAGLGPHPTVSFGTRRALVLGATMHLLRVRIPRGARNVQVKVKTAFGVSSAGPSSRFSY